MKDTNLVPVSDEKAELPRTAAPVGAPEPRRVAVAILRGSVPSERSVSFRATGRTFVLRVDEADMNERESTMRVYVLDARAEHVLVQFPGEPSEGLESPRGTWLPRSLVLGLRASSSSAVSPPPTGMVSGGEGP